MFFHKFIFVVSALCADFSGHRPNATWGKTKKPRLMDEKGLTKITLAAHFSQADPA
jgi:hypothetical protein